MTDLEKKYFELSVLGILADRTRMGEFYESKIPNNQSIINFFLEKENCTMLDIKTWIEKYNLDILRIRSLPSKERIEGFGSRESFLQWYLSAEKKCCYCGIKEEDLNRYFNEQNPQYFVSNDKDDKARQRGKVLEIERVVTAPKSKNVYTLDNTRLACYVCNNAKSDFLSATDFKPIAFGIYNFWKEIVPEITFPEEVYKRFKS